ncbi:orotate phosphoribosyltransferase [Flavobacteriaceae bacterium]|nr:orotate phosphoribosyltransferase [Flavobacteriaceae bacterium]MDA9571978.1 orotate phosphoribosyltransferase [Flavobacteriaceae bacterium]MDC3354437.1 orotate phosphoribosyltransferase [Flavobacteriaceae bacterium]
MVFSQKIAQQTAESLLQINAIKLNPKNPFTWASGWQSPIYCDNRVALSYHDIRTFLCNALAEEIQEKYNSNIVIAGVATGAIGIGMLVAQKLELPFIYVRPEPKKHGRKNQIEGKLESNQKIVVIEDLISTGKSSLNAVNAIKEANCEVLEMLALFTYGFPQASNTFEQAQVTLKTLCDYQHLLNVALHQNKITETQAQKLHEWRKDPANWTP